MVASMSSSPQTPAPVPGPAPTARLRRELVARANRLKAQLSLGRQGLTDALVAHVRAELDRADLLKIRIDIDDRDEAERAAEELAARIPCHLVQRIGRVALLYRPLPDKPAETGD